MTYVATDTGDDFKLKNFKWTEDIAVSGIVVVESTE
jgi:hypothetical protein